MKPLDSSATPQLLAVLDEIDEFLEDQEDVRDGSDGVQLPNKAMSLRTDLIYARTRFEEASARSETGAMEFADNTATKAIVSASTPKEGEIEENLTEIEDAIWNATGSALLSGEKAGAADKSIIYRSLCAAGNKVAYVRELLTARSSTALPEPAKDLQEANEIIEILRGELARVAIAVGRTKDGTGYDLDWFALHKDIPAPRSAIATPNYERCFDAICKALEILERNRSTWNGPVHRAVAVLVEAVGPQGDKE